MVDGRRQKGRLRLDDYLSRIREWNGKLNISVLENKTKEERYGYVDVSMYGKSMKSSFIKIASISMST